MSNTLVHKIDYMVALISEFGSAHGLTVPQAYLYLNEHKGLDFVEEFYDVEHTLPFGHVVEDLTSYCKRMGGSLA